MQFFKNFMINHKKKILFYCFAFIPFVLLLFLWLILSINPLTGLSCEVFPGKNIANRIYVLTDKNWHGNSVIEEYSFDDKRLVLKYRLREGAVSPLVFLSLSFDPAWQASDLSAYESVTLQIKEATCKRITMFIKTNVPGFPQPEPEQWHKLRHNQYILQLVPDKQRYTIELKDFITPFWWINMMQMESAKLPAESFKEAISLDMQFNLEGMDYKLNQHEKIVIEKIVFNRTLPPLFFLLLGGIIFYYLGFSLYLVLKKLQRDKRKFPQQVPLTVPLQRDKELQRIKDFIEVNYHDAEISTELIYSKLGIPRERVFKLVKEEYGLSFKQLIHTLRIREAMRLLKETDLRIIDIALNLGFNNISYFNNIFKQQTKQTPSAYRDADKQKTMDNKKREG